jgi:hypothetical protein
MRAISRFLRADRTPARRGGVSPHPRSRRGGPPMRCPVSEASRESAGGARRGPPASGLRGGLSQQGRALPLEPGHPRRAGTTAGTRCPRAHRSRARPPIAGRRSPVAEAVAILDRRVDEVDAELDRSPEEASRGLRILRSPHPGESYGAESHSIHRDLTGELHRSGQPGRGLRPLSREMRCGHGGSFVWIGHLDRQPHSTGSHSADREAREPGYVAPTRSATSRRMVTQASFSAPQSLPVLTMTTFASGAT